MGTRTSNIGHVNQVLGADGGFLTVTDLPPKNLKRWIARRKADVVAAVEGDLLSEAEACARYNISPEEFSAWLNAYVRDGVAGLRARANARGMRRRDHDSGLRYHDDVAEDIHHTGLG